MDRKVYDSSDSHTLTYARLQLVVKMSVSNHTPVILFSLRMFVCVCRSPSHVVLVFKCTVNRLIHKHFLWLTQTHTQNREKEEEKNYRNDITTNINTWNL